MQETHENKYHYLVALMLAVVGLLVILIFVSMRSAAEEESGDASATINNTAPTIDSIDITDSGSPYNEGTEHLTLNEGPANSGGETSDNSDTITVTINYTDLNSCDEVETDGRYSLFLAEEEEWIDCSSGVSDYNDCYFENSLSSSFTCTDDCNGDADTTGSIVCEFPMNHFSDPGEWRVKVSIFDGAEATDSSIINFTIDTVTALSLLDTTLDFGSLALAATSSADAVTTKIRNTGNNNSMALSAYGADDMQCSGFGEIPVENLKIDNDAGTEYASKSFSLATTSAAVGQTVTKQTQQTTVSEGTALETLYWGIQIPTTGVAGTCTTTVTVVGA